MKVGLIAGIIYRNMFQSTLYVIILANSSQIYLFKLGLC